MAHLFECRACFRCSLDVLSPAHSYRLSSLPRQSLCRAARYNTLTEHHRGTRLPEHGEAFGKSERAFERANTAKNALRKQRSVENVANSSDHDAKLQRHLKAELKYLTDPVKLAQHIAATLEKNDEAKAVALARLSSRATANVVSWNHIINWQMKKGKTQVAIDTYNDMKKRSQKPDSHTYLLLLRGLGVYAQHPSSLGRALSLYHAMSAPNSSVAPTIYHTNAVLKVCARAGDMDSMWHIASTLPEKGPHAADNWTFTTILNSLRQHALSSGYQEESKEQAAVRVEQAIVEGRRLWEVIIKRWRAGDVLVDEELACAMGRLLLIGARPRDWDNVLSLAQQTMGLPRLVPRLGTSARMETQPRIRAPHSPQNMKNNVAGELVDANGDLRPGAEFNIDVFGSARDGVDKTENARPVVGKKSAHVYAEPSNSALSLILDACLHMAAKQPGVAYWDLLTDPNGQYGVTPDMDNMNMYLRILRFAKASRDALKFLREDFEAAGLKPSRKSYHLAMSTCQRDSLNPNAIDNANGILEHAINNLAEPGALLFRLFLDTVEATRPDVQTQIKALDRLDSKVVNLRSLLNFGSVSEAEREAEAKAGKAELSTGQQRAFAREVERERNEAVELMKAMVRMYDRILDLSKGRELEMGTTREQWALCNERKKRLSAFVYRQVHKQIARNIQETGWRTTDPRRDAASDRQRQGRSDARRSVR